MSAKPYDVGIDAGAISTKVLLLKDGKVVVGHRTAPTTMEPGKIAKGLMDSLLAEKGVGPDEVQTIVATGQGRKAVSFAGMARTEITAFAKGAHFLQPDAAIVVDIGGHGIRAMRMGEMGIISDFKTNDKCSTGTGCFMDTMSVALEVDIKDAGDRSLRSKIAENINSTCTVFAESEVVSLIAKGKTTEDILAGLHRMVASRIVALVNATQSKGKVVVCGGVALNKGVVKELGEIIDREMYVPEDPHMVGALGAALLAPRGRPKTKVEQKEGPGKRAPFLKRLLGVAR